MSNIFRTKDRGYCEITVICSSFTSLVGQFNIFLHHLRTERAYFLEEIYFLLIFGEKESQNLALCIFLLLKIKPFNFPFKTAWNEDNCDTHSLSQVPLLKMLLPIRLQDPESLIPQEWIEVWSWFFMCG